MRQGTTMWRRVPALLISAAAILFSAGPARAEDEDRSREAQCRGFVEADARLGWRISPKLELYVAGQSLLHETHAESIDPSRAQLDRRSVTREARIRF